MGLQLLLLLVIYFTADATGLVFFLLQSCIAIGMLHNINYLQHYGLMREQNHDGHYERISAHHAWNTSNNISTVSLFHLENHADHHLHPTHSYEQLKELHESPIYPTGYSGMMLLTLVPPLWFKITNKDLSFKQHIT
jgi:alkane 1-monooxygenase